MDFQGFTVEHGKSRTTLYPYCKEFKTVCVYLEDDDTYVAHTTKGNKMGKLEKSRKDYSLKELQELCALVVSDSNR